MSALFLNTFYWNHPESHGHGVFPVYLWRASHQYGSETLMSLLFARYHRSVPGLNGSPVEGRFFVAGGLFWHGENLDRRLDDSAGFRYTYLLPFFYSYQDDPSQTKFTGVLPFGYHRENPKASVTSLLWLYNKRTEKAPDGTVLRVRTMLLPAFWNEERPQEETSRTLIGPLYHYQSPGEERSVLFPVYFHQKSELDSHRVVFPFYYSFPDEAHPTRFTVFPFFGYSKGSDSQRLITPLGFYSKDSDSKNALFLTAFYKDNPEVTSRGIAPFYLKRFDKVELSTSRLFFPMLFQYERPVLGTGGPGEPLQKTLPGTVTTLAGLVWHGENLSANLEDAPGRTFTTVFPFVFWKKEAQTEEKSLTVGPFFWRSSPEKTNTGLFPLALVGKKRVYEYTPDGQGGFIEEPGYNKYQYLFPLYFHNKKASGDSTTYAGLLFWTTRRGTDVRGGLWPLVKFYNVGLEQGREKGLRVLPLFQYWTSPGQSHFDSLPLSLHQDGETKGGRALTAFWERGPDQSRTAFLPLFWFSKDEDKKINYALNYFNIEKANGDQTSLLFPFYLSTWTYNRTRHKVIFPLGYYAEEPFLQKKSLYVLNYHNTQSPELRSQGLWPIAQSVWRKEGAESNETGFSYIFPLYLYKKEAEGESLVTPFSYYSRVNDYTKYWVLPYYGTRAGDSYATNYVFPFFYWHEKGEEKLSVMGPLYVGYQKGPLKVRVGLPLVLDIQTKKAKAQIITPLYIHTEGKKAERWRVALIWSYSKYNKEYFLSRGANESELTDFELRLPPILKYTKDNEESYQWKVLLGLVGFERNGASRRIFVFGVPVKLKDKPKK